MNLLKLTTQLLRIHKSLVAIFRCVSVFRFFCFFVFSSLVCCVCLAFWLRFDRKGKQMKTLNDDSNNSNKNNYRSTLFVPKLCIFCRCIQCGIFVESIVVALANVNTHIAFPVNVVDISIYWLIFLCICVHANCQNSHSIKSNHKSTLNH